MLRYKVWHYSGALRCEHKVPADHELWMVNWQPGTAAPAPVVTAALPKGTARPASDSKVTKAYVPPGARGLPPSQRINVTIKGRCRGVYRAGGVTLSGCVRVCV